MGKLHSTIFLAGLLQLSSRRAEVQGFVMQHRPATTENANDSNLRHLTFWDDQPDDFSVHWQSPQELNMVSTDPPLSTYILIFLGRILFPIPLDRCAG